MRRSVRRTMAVFMCMAMLLSLVSCKKTKITDSPFSSYYSTKNKILSISHETSSLFCGDNIFVQSFYQTDEYWDAYHDQCVPKQDDEEEKEYPLFPVDEKGNVITPENLLYVLDEKGKIQETYDLNEECGPSLENRAMFCKEDECWVLSKKTDISTGAPAYSLDRIDPSDGVTKHIDLDASFTKMNATDFLISEDGDFVLKDAGQRVLFVADDEGKLKDQITLPETQHGGVVSLQGKLTCQANGTEKPTMLWQYDDKKDQWRETGMSVTDAWNKLVVRNDDLFSIESSKIVWMDEESSDALSLEEASVYGLVRDLRILDDGEVELLVRPRSNELLVWYHLTPSDKKTHQNKKEFVIAGYDLVESPIPQLVEELSILHPEVKFKMRDYMDEIKSSDENWAQVQREIYEIISLDIANGKAPDMYYDYYDDTGLGELGRLGYLKDLTPYLEELDEKNYFMDKIVMGEDVPYCASLSFNVLGFQASSKYVENPEVWTYEDFYRSAEKFTDLSCIQTIYSKQKLLMNGVMAQMDSFVYDGIADFTGEDFIQLLKWANDIGRQSDWDDYEDPELDSGYFMLDWASFSSPGSVLNYAEHVIVGYPNEDGSLHATPYNILAISATTTHADLAGEIICYALGEEFQSSEGMRVSGIPVNRKVWDQQFETTYKLHFEGPLEPIYSKEEYREMDLRIVERANHYLHGSQSIVDICIEEAGAYFAGAYSAEHAAELIENRVNTYLQETST